MQILKENLEIDESDISCIIITNDSLRRILICVLYTEFCYGAKGIAFITDSTAFQCMAHTPEGDN